MTWRVLSPLVGRPGDLFVPPAGTNVEALVAGGFIEQVGTIDAEPAPSRRKVKKNTED
jgi:hypothetical protein